MGTGERSGKKVEMVVEVLWQTLILCCSAQAGLQEPCKG